MLERPRRRALRRRAVLRQPAQVGARDDDDDDARARGALPLASGALADGDGAADADGGDAKKKKKRRKKEVKGPTISEGCLLKFKVAQLKIEGDMLTIVGAMNEKGLGPYTP